MGGCARQGILLLLAAAAFLAGITEANPGLLKAIANNPDKLNMVLDGLAKDSAFIEARDMGVRHMAFSFRMANPVFPHSPEQLSVRLDLFCRYMLWTQPDETQQATLKCMLSAETREIHRIGGVDLYAEPIFTLSSAPNNTASLQHSFTARAAVHSAWDPPAQAALVFGIETTMHLGAGWPRDAHHWRLSMDLDQNTSYAWSPLEEINGLDGRGAHVAPTSGCTLGAARETYVVLKPSPEIPYQLLGHLIVRHAEYYLVSQGRQKARRTLVYERASVQILLPNHHHAHAAITHIHAHTEPGRLQARRLPAGDGPRKPHAQQPPARLPRGYRKDPAGPMGPRTAARDLPLAVRPEDRLHARLAGVHWA
jgi:hypothetical protein